MQYVILRRERHETPPGYSWWIEGWYSDRAAADRAAHRLAVARPEWELSVAYATAVESALEESWRAGRAPSVEGHVTSTQRADASQREIDRHTIEAGGAPRGHRPPAPPLPDRESEGEP